MKYSIFGIWHTKHQKQPLMRCAKCLKIMRHVTVRSQIWKRTDRNAIILLIILFTFLSPPTHISICLQHSYLSLSSLVSISPLLPISSSLSFFYISHSLSLSLHFGIITTDPTHLCAPLSLSLSLFLSLSLSLSFPVTKKKAIPIWSIACRLKLANLNLCSPIWSSACLGAIADLCSSSSKLSPPMVGWVWSLIDLLGWGFVEDFEFLFYFIFYFVEVFWFGICWRIRWLWL